MLRPSLLSSPKLLPILLLRRQTRPVSQAPTPPNPLDFRPHPRQWSLSSPHPSFPLDSDFSFPERPPTTLDLTPAFSRLYGLLSFLHLSSLLLPPFPSLSPQTPSLLPLFPPLPAQAPLGKAPFQKEDLFSPSLYASFSLPECVKLFPS